MNGDARFVSRRQQNWPPARGITQAARRACKLWRLADIRAHARVLNIKLRVGVSAEHALQPPRLAYLVVSAGAIGLNGISICARDSAAKDVAAIRITAREDADIVMVDLPREIG